MKLFQSILNKTYSQPIEKKFPSDSPRYTGIVNDHYRVVYILPKPNLLYIRVEGEVAYADFAKMYEQRWEFLASTGDPHRKIVELRDYSKICGRPSRAQRVELAHVYSQYEQYIHCSIFANASPFLEAAFYISYRLGFVKTPLLIIREISQAYVRACEISTSLNSSPIAITARYDRTGDSSRSRVKKSIPRVQVEQEIDRALSLISSFSWEKREEEIDNYDEIESPFRELFDSLLLVKEDVQRLLDDQRNVNEILERRVAERTTDLERMNAELIRADQLKSNFVATVSHELRTPLTSVVGFAKLTSNKLEKSLFPILSNVSSKVDQTIGQVRANIRIITTESERLSFLINDLLDIAKMESGKTEWKQVLIDPVAVVEHAIVKSNPLFTTSSVKLTTEIQPNLPFFTGDDDRIMQVLCNLLSNAAKFTEFGAITVRVLLVDGSIHFSVSDTGEGIALEHLESIFEKFVQVGDTLTNKPKGTGLGLSISKEIVEHHGGKIWAESEVGKGSSFMFEIPLRDSSVEDEKNSK